MRAHSPRAAPPLVVVAAPRQSSSSSGVAPCKSPSERERVVGGIYSGGQDGRPLLRNEVLNSGARRAVGSGAWGPVDGRWGIGGLTGCGIRPFEASAAAYAGRGSHDATTAREDFEMGGTAARCGLRCGGVSCELRRVLGASRWLAATVLVSVTFYGFSLTFAAAASGQRDGQSRTGIFLNSGCVHLCCLRGFMRNDRS